MANEETQRECYAGTNPAELFKSVDGGRNWKASRVSERLSIERAGVFRSIPRFRVRQELLW